MINKGVINNIDIYNLYYLFYFINNKYPSCIYCGPEPSSNGGRMKSGSMVLKFHGPT